MLTKVDLSQIRKVVREEVEAEVKDSTRTLEGEVRLSRMRVQSDISELDDRMKNVEIRINSVETKITKMHKSLKKEIKIVSNTLDKEDLKTVRRVRRIEEHLGLSNTQ